MASLLYSGTNPKTITYNSADVKTVIYNGVTVWSKANIDRYIITTKTIGSNALVEISGVKHLPIKFIDDKGKEQIYNEGDNGVGKESNGVYIILMEGNALPAKGVTGYSIIESIDGKAVNK